ncbi:MAG: PorV/PorQ family protein [Thermonemataceae bacterium]|nr:PorV/PorQ family protein [Thermonemataceae bacterium]
MSKRVFYSFILWICANHLFAQYSPKYSNEFLNIGVGARALAMSGAMTAATDDVTATYWNPAALLQIKSKYQVAAMHAEYFAGIAQYDYAAFATPVDSNSHIGLSVIRFGVDDIPDTRFLYDANGAINYNNVRFFSAADYAFQVSYAKRLPKLKNLQLGANFKIIYRQAGDFATAWGFGLDAAAAIQLKKWRLGVMARDITGTFTAWRHNLALLYTIYAQTNNPIPQNSVEITVPKLNIGLSRRFPIKEKFGLMPALEIQNTFDGKRNTLLATDFVSISPALGLEIDYQNLIFLRAGLGNIQDIKNFDGSTYKSVQSNFGAGFRIKRFSIDYALTDVVSSDAGLYSHIFSIKADF